MIKAVIVDDEPKAIQGLSWELSHFSKDVEVIKTFTIPEDAITYINKHALDCLFLDIQMPTMDGFQFLERLAHRDMAVVITTAYDDYAIKALKNDAIDYLLKPIDTEDLAHTIEKIIKFKSRSNSNSKIEEVLESINERFDNKKITINTDGKILFLDIDDIIFVESDGNYSTIYTVENQKIVITKKLKEVDALLPDHYFFRIHNSFIINLNKIKEFIKSDGYVVMNTNHRIPVARQRKSDFLEKL